MTARKPNRPKTYAKAQVREITYGPEHDELFALAGASWQRPRKVRVAVTRTTYTFDAKFITGEGVPAALRVRARRYADGKVYITEQRMALHLAISGKGGSA